MNKKIFIIIVLSVVVAIASFFFFKSNSGGGGVSITGSGTQNIDASQQGGGVENFNNSGNIENVVVESEGGSHACKGWAKDYGVFKYNGRKGPLCKSTVARKINEKKCDKKGTTRHNNLCVMEWKSKGGYWRVRILK